MPSEVAPLQRFSYATATTNPASLNAFHTGVLAAMDRDGGVIVEDALDSADCNAIIAEMRPFLDATSMGNNSFSGRKTRRTGALAARSPASHKALTHPAVLAVCDAVLGEQRLSGNAVQLAHDVADIAVAPVRKDRETPRPRYPWQLHLTQIIDIGPGETGQHIHRDKWAFLHDFRGSEVEISTMWALTPFTEANGATRVVPGSHRWDEKELRAPLTVDDSTFAAMPAGSVLIYTGNTFHAGGANKTSERRVGLNVDYNLAFLRQEENQYLAAPPHLARNFSRDLQRLIGYSMGGAALGYFAEGLNPRVALKGYDVSVPGGSVSKL